MVVAAGGAWARVTAGVVPGVSRVCVCASRAGERGQGGRYGPLSGAWSGGVCALALLVRGAWWGVVCSRGLTW